MARRQPAGPREDVTESGPAWGPVCICEITSLCSTPRHKERFSVRTSFLPSGLDRGSHNSEAQKPLSGIKRAGIRILVDHWWERTVTLRSKVATVRGRDNDLQPCDWGWAILARVPAQQRSRGEHPQKLTFQQCEARCQDKGPCGTEPLQPDCSTTWIELFAMLGRKARSKVCPFL